MRIFIVSHKDIVGGGARAAYRIHHALLNNNINSTMLVDQSTSGDFTVVGPEGKWNKVNIRSPIGSIITKLLRPHDTFFQSIAILPSKYPTLLNQCDADVVNLHWINGEMISIADIRKINKPIVWTLHDMWAFCGSEHCTQENRWRDGYSVNNREPNGTGFDLSRWTWQRKLRHWKVPIHIITPSNWLANCVRNSALMSDWPVSVIPNPLNTSKWMPIDKKIARKLLGLPSDIPLLLFGAWREGWGFWKGSDLLQEALEHLSGQIPDLELVMFGQLSPKEPKDLGFPIHYTGFIHDDITLQLLYSAVDVSVIPSRVEVFCQVASESHACGTPVVAFDNSGVTDIITHLETGYLAKALDTQDFANGILWVLGDSERHHKLSVQARRTAVHCFSYPIVAEKYIKVYQSAIHADSIKKE